MRRPRSLAFPLGSDGFGRRNARGDRRALSQSLPKLSQRRPLGDTADLLHEVVGERQAFHGSAHLELSMEVIGNVAELDHPGHAKRISAVVDMSTRRPPT